jgi:tRNA pseudouridine55 synthase
MSALSGLLVVDKPAGLTSHDVVARVRRLAGTRRVGHAGTLDPAATGVLLMGLEKGTKLLGHLALTDKDYTATIRLGQATTTDDSEGEQLSAASAAGLVDEAVRAGMLALTGTIQQIPSAVSAIKVGGQRAYARVRAGETVELAARTVTVSEFATLTFRRPSPDLLDVDVRVTCTSGTYVRALARDLGASLQVGGHLVALRRTRVGPYGLDAATALADLPSAADGAFPLIPLADAVAGSFPRIDVGAQAALDVSFGRALPLDGDGGTVGVFGPDGDVLALMEAKDGALRPLVVFAPA